MQELCNTDSEKARKALGEFAEYLRGNMDSLTDTAPIHFTREMAHVENYLKLEKMRFGDELNIILDINIAIQIGAIIKKSHISYNYN